MATTDNVHLGVDIDKVTKEYLRVAAFMTNQSVSGYVRSLIEKDTSKHPDWVDMAKERSDVDA